jgi:hypothetical protein
MIEKGARVVEPVHKIVLSGASGTLGAALRQRLEADRVPAVQLVRGQASGQQQVPWDPARDPAIGDASVLEGCTASVHLAGANLAARRWTPSYRDELRSSRVNSTRALALSLAGLRKPPRVLLVASAVGIYGDRGDTILDEASEPGAGFLADLCREWEAAAEPAREAGIRVVHARFGPVLGPGPGALGKMVPIFRMGLGGRLGSGRQWMSWVSLDDAVEAILFAMRTEALNGPVNVTAPHPVSNAEFTQVLARVLHRPAILPAPAFALRLALGPMADEALLASARVLPAKLLEAGFQFEHVTVDNALAEALL